ncbi:MAG: UbiA family prenyltransferase [Methanolobus sp.]|nr:UbiA family prenyltransferase [Methanolobus sp.]
MNSNCTISLPGPVINKYEPAYRTFWNNILPTINLLKSSVLVSFSGALRIHIAFLLMNISSVFWNCLAGGLIIYSVYTLDRAMDSEEDMANRPELKGASNRTALVVSLMCFVAGAAILTINGLMIIAFLPLITGYLYSKGLKIGKFDLKLKGGLGKKNMVVGITWGAFIAGIAGVGATTVVTPLIVFLYFAMKLFINSTIYDFKDIKGDMLAGIRTLPVVLGQGKAKKLLFSLHLLSHSILLVSIIAGFIAFEPVIIIYSLLIGLIYIKSFAEQVEKETKKRLTKRLFMIDGESTSITGLRTLVYGAAI